MGARRIRREQRQLDQATSRTVNGTKKMHEQSRRAKRLTELLKKGTYPYTPTIRSWLSQTLDKPSSKITEDDVKQLLQQSDG